MGYFGCLGHYFFGEVSGGGSGVALGEWGWGGGGGGEGVVGGGG